jgi:hypothetical protein
MIYLASPYTGTKEEMQERYDRVLHVTATLLCGRVWVYSPIVHCHDMAVKYRLPRDINFWHAFDKAILSSAREFWILMLPGWEVSKGILFEYAVADSRNMPIRFVHIVPGWERILVSNEKVLKEGGILYDFPLI